MKTERARDIEDKEMKLYFENNLILGERKKWKIGRESLERIQIEINERKMYKREREREKKGLPSDLFVKLSNMTARVMRR